MRNGFEGGALDKFAHAWRASQDRYGAEVNIDNVVFMI